MSAIPPAFHKRQIFKVSRNFEQSVDGVAG
jgi:hypothetical protein